jgi:tetratricopeptide (TPR) repeat protein
LIEVPPGAKSILDLALPAPEHRRVALLLCVLIAAGTGHRAKAERAEALGRMIEAAAEYEAAWVEEEAAELLYRLGVVRRKLKEYGKAREALRAYLRVAPEGGLREEVERQLKKIEVLIEAEKEDYSDPPKRKRAPPLVAPPPAPALVAPPVSVPPPAPALVAPPPAPAAPMIAPPVAAPPLVAAAPRAAILPVEAPPRSRAAPWLLGASAVAVAAGAALWWDGARVSRDLDARFAAGDLSAADRPLFGRAQGESIAGRVLVVAGVGLLAAAVWLW